jgi:hypothetical protein
MKCYFTISCARVIGSVFALLVAASSLQAQPTSTATTKRQDCASTNNDPEQRIAACTLVLADRSETAASRANAYKSRGLAYYNKRDYDRAIRFPIMCVNP